MIPNKKFKAFLALICFTVFLNFRMDFVTLPQSSMASRNSTVEDDDIYAINKKDDDAGVYDGAIGSDDIETRDSTSTSFNNVYEPVAAAVSNENVIKTQDEGVDGGDAKNDNGNGSHLPFQSSTECRRKVEKDHFKLWDEWLDNKVPILHSAINIHGRVHIFFFTLHLQEFTKKFQDSTWFCNVNDNDDAKAETYAGPKSNVITVVCDYTSLSSSSSSLPDFTNIHSSVPSNITGEIVKYDVTALLQCDKLEDQEMLQSTTNYNNTKFGSCLMFRGDESRSQMHEWIEYHRMIGIEHFWIFMNEPWSMRDLPDLPYVTYIPYDFYFKDHHNHTTYRYWAFSIQVPMQIECLHKMKKYNVEWVTTTDLDEYIFINNENATNQTDISELQYLINSIPNAEKAGGLRLNSIPFGRNKAEEPGEKKKPLLIDYIYRNKGNPWDMKMTREKIIYNPRIAYDVGVHYMYGRYPKPSVINLGGKNGAHLNHYKDANKGVHKLRNRYDLMEKDTAIVDRYREKLVDALHLDGH